MSASNFIHNSQKGGIDLITFFFLVILVVLSVYCSDLAEDNEGYAEFLRAEFPREYSSYVAGRRNIEKYLIQHPRL